MAMVGLHIASLIGDSFVHFGAADVLRAARRPRWRPVPVALGVLSLYLLAAVEVTSLAMRRLSRRAWRAVHLTSYGLVWLVSLHAGLAGSDVFNLAYRGVAVVLTVAAVAATCVRLLTPRRRGPETGRRERVGASTATATGPAGGA